MAQRRHRTHPLFLLASREKLALVGTRYCVSSLHHIAFSFLLFFSLLPKFPAVNGAQGATWSVYRESARMTKRGLLRGVDVSSEEGNRRVSSSESFFSSRLIDSFSLRSCPFLSTELHPRARLVVPSLGHHLLLADPRSSRPDLPYDVARMSVVRVHRRRFSTSSFGGRALFHADITATQMEHPRKAPPDQSLAQLPSSPCLLAVDISSPANITSA